MDSSGAQHYQEMSTNSVDRKARPQPEQALKCPRCDSTNTKFCYYNNYSLSQPRYFCKSCRRYWTKGGTLRNVPVGGGCRKNKRSSSSKRTPDHQQPEMITSNNQNPLSSFSNPLINYDSHDLTLAFARLQKQSNGQLGYDNDHDNLSMFGSHSDAIYGNPVSNCPEAATNPDLLEAIRGNFLEAHHAGNGNFQDLYYGFGNNVTSHMGGELQNGAGLNGVDKVLWGFPWQINGDGNMTSHDSGRESWNGFAAAPWHGLLNSPLM